MVLEDWIANTDMSSHALVKTSVREDPICGCEVLLAVQTFLFERVEFGIRSYLERFPAFGFAKRSNCGIAICFGAQCGC